MPQIAIMTSGLFFLAVLSGMLGLGVAFAAIYTKLSPSSFKNTYGNNYIRPAYGGHSSKKFRPFASEVMVG